MKILLSNDDGIYAKGLQVLYNELSELGEVYVVAPDRNRSGASNSLTLNAPLHLKMVADNHISVEGTPTDCVHLALTGLLDFEPDMVVSGINSGSNLGDDVLYSGTVAAAMEGRSLGYPALAVSLQENGRFHFESAGWVARKLVTRMVHEPLPRNTMLNINVPDIPIDDIDGYDVTRLGTRHLAEHVIKEKDPRGHDIYWIGPPGPEEDAGPGTDFYSIYHSRVSVTPLQVDVTHYQAFEQLTPWIEGLNIEKSK
jgi:5'-nucleotidase